MTRAALLSDPTTRRAFQSAYDNRMPAEGGEWCEGYAVDHCDQGTEANVATIARPNFLTGRPDSCTLCPSCRAQAAVADLDGVVGAIADALAGLPVSDTESHRVTTLRATLSAALREAQAERASWERAQ
jgi:hypothetical protein